MLLPAEEQPESKSEEPLRQPAWHSIFTRGRVVIAAWALGIPVALASILLLVSYHRYAKLIDARLKHGPFADSVNIYAAPLTVSSGDQMTPADLVAELRT